MFKKILRVLLVAGIALTGLAIVTMGVDLWHGRIQVINANGAVVATYWGADPTGTVDSTTAFQDVINAIASSKGTARIPAGIYKVSQLNATNLVGLHLEGESGNSSGSFQTEIKCIESSANSGNCLDLTGTLSVTMDDITWIGGSSASNAPNVVILQGKSGQPQWLASHGYGPNSSVSNNLNWYTSASGGTSGASAPTCTSGTCSDGGITWTWEGAGNGLLNIGTNGSFHNVNVITYGNYALVNYGAEVFDYNDCHFVQQGSAGEAVVVLGSADSLGISSQFATIAATPGAPVSMTMISFTGAATQIASEGTGFGVEFDGSVYQITMAGYGQIKSASPAFFGDSAAGYSIEDWIVNNFRLEPIGSPPSAFATFNHDQVINSTIHGSYVVGANNATPQGGGALNFNVGIEQGDDVLLDYYTGSAPQPPTITCANLASGSMLIRYTPNESIGANCYSATQLGPQGILPPRYTVAQLPACIVGELAEVTNANAACAINQVPVGGSPNLTCPIYCNSSSAWVEY